MPTDKSTDATGGARTAVAASGVALDAVETPHKYRLDDRDKALLNDLQSNFGLVPEPYAAAGDRVGVPEAEVIERLRRLDAVGTLREVTPIFDTRALGYRSTLAAASVEKEKLRAAAAVVNAHPGVSHNYERNDKFNLWFTIAVPGDSRLGIERTLDALSQSAGFDSCRMLPTVRLFKINVNLEMDGAVEKLAAQGPPQSATEVHPVEVSTVDIEVVRATQGPMPIVSRPFDEAANRLGWSSERLLEHLEGMRERKMLRRVAAIVNHRRAGFSANGMGVWNVPPERIAQVGASMAAVRGVTHCYQRPTYEDWPYNVFTMVHARKKNDCDQILHSISVATGVEDYRILYSRREFKKIRLRYFTPENAAWETRHGGAGC